jgi:hypothetical protein
MRPGRAALAATGMFDVGAEMVPAVAMWKTSNSGDITVAQAMPQRHARASHYFLQSDREALLQPDIGIGGVMPNERSNFVESRFVPAIELAPETARFLWAKQAHIENAVAVAVFKCAERPAPGGHFEPENEFGSGLNPNLLCWAFEESIGLPQRDVDDVFLRGS